MGVPFSDGVLSTVGVEGEESSSSSSLLASLLDSLSAGLSSSNSGSGANRLIL